MGFTITGSAEQRAKKKDAMSFSGGLGSLPKPRGPYKPGPKRGQIRKGLKMTESYKRKTKERTAEKARRHRAGLRGE
jgi:hypothetical protein